MRLLFAALLVLVACKASDPYCTGQCPSDAPATDDGPVDAPADMAVPTPDASGSCITSATLTGTLLVIVLDPSVLPGTVLAIDQVDTPTILGGPAHVKVSPAGLTLSTPGTAPVAVFLGAGSTICRAAIL